MYEYELERWLDAIDAAQELEERYGYDIPKRTDDDFEEVEL